MPKQPRISSANARSDFSEIFRALPLPAAITEPSRFAFVDVNDAWVSLFGYSRRQLLGKSALDVGLVKASPHRTRLVSTLNRRGQLSGIERTLYTASGAERIVMMSTTRVRVGGRRLVLTSLQDVTERRQAEQALAQSRQKFYALFQRAALPAALTDAKTLQIVDVNDAFLRLFGYEREELVGRTALQAGIHPSRRLERELAGQLNRGGEIAGLEIEAVAKDGSPVPVLVNISAALIGGQEHFITTLQDIRERRSLEQALLEGVAREHARIASDLHEGVGQQLAALGIMMATVRDQARRRQPIDAAHLAEIGTTLANATRACRAMARVLAPIELSGERLAPAIRSAIAEWQGLRRTKVHFVANRRALELSLPVRTADSLFRIAMEAFTNAMQHARAVNVYVSVNADRHGVTVAVEDDGTGFPARAAVETGSGLKAMALRARLIGAELSFRTGGGGGTAVECRYRTSRGRTRAMPRSAAGGGLSRN